MIRGFGINENLKVTKKQLFFIVKKIRCPVMVPQILFPEIMEKVDPVDYIRRLEKPYLHFLYNFALGMDTKIVGDSDLDAFVPILARETGNHYLMLSHLLGKMPDAKGNALLETLVEKMDAVRLTQDMDRGVYTRLDEVYSVLIEIRTHVSSYST
jgi:hypothetical protein